MAHFLESGDERNSFLSIEKQAASFGFSRRGWNAAESFAEHMDRAIWGRIRRSGERMVAEKVDAGTTAAGVW